MRATALVVHAGTVVGMAYPSDPTDVQWALRVPATPQLSEKPGHATADARNWWAVGVIKTWVWCVREV